MAIKKDTATLGMAWEEDFGYVQGVRVGDTVYVAGQISHDELGNIVGVGDMAAQMRQAYANVAKVLAQFGASMANVVEEVTFVTDIEAAAQVAPRLRREGYGGRPVATSTLVQVVRLAWPELLIEVRCVAKV